MRPIVRPRSGGLGHGRGALQAGDSGAETIRERCAYRIVIVRDWWPSSSFRLVLHHGPAREGVPQGVEGDVIELGRPTAFSEAVRSFQFWNTRPESFGLRLTSAR
jgi:hypothetical protein